MKSFNHLFEKLISHDNIELAIHNASKGKHKRKDVQNILNNIEYHIEKIQNILINNKFKVQKHITKVIKDGSSHKEREIVQPNFVYEQIIHHAVMNILIPILKKGMYEYTCGSIPGRGNLYGKKYIEKIKREDKKNTKWFLKLDIKKFFPNINRTILKNMLYKIIHDNRFYKVLETIIDSHLTGLPIGFYTSQWLANFYLQPLDHFIKEILRIPYYIRYMDDMVLFASTKEELIKAYRSICEFCESISLKIKSAYQLSLFADCKKHRHTHPISFMGYRFYRQYTLLRKNILFKISRKIIKVLKKGFYTFYDALQLISGYGWFKYTDTHKKFKELFIDNHIYLNQLRYKISIHQRIVNENNFAITF